MESGAQQYAAHLSAAVQTLEGRAASLNARKKEYEALTAMLQQLPEQLTHDVMVPVAGCAFFPGSIVHTNEILVLLGENYFAERTASQARQIVQRRLDYLKENIQAVERQLGAFQTRKDVIDDYQREGIVDIQEEYHSDDEAEKKKKMQSAREKEKIAEEEAVRRRNMFVKAVKPAKEERTDEDFERLEKRLAELEAEEARTGGGAASAAGAAEEGAEEEEEEGEEEEGEEEEGDEFDAFYSGAGGDDDESVSDDGEGEEEPAEISEEGEEGEEDDDEEDTRASRQLKPVHLRTKTPPHPSKRPLKPAPPPAHVSAPAPSAATETSAKPRAGVSFKQPTEPIEKPRTATQTLAPFVRPPVPPGKLKPCLAPPRPITVAAPPPKEVRWQHSTDEDLPRYKTKPAPAPPVAAGNRSRSSARGPPPPSAQALQAAAAAAAASAPPPVAATKNVAIGEVMERAPPEATAASASAGDAPAAAAEAPRKVSRYRAMMEQRQGH